MKKPWPRTIEVNGDVLPSVDYYDGIEEDRMKDPSAEADLEGYAQRMRTQRKHAMENATKVAASPAEGVAPAEKLEYETASGLRIPREVLMLAFDAAHEEDGLRKKGYTERRIADIAGKNLSMGMVHLQMKGIDTSTLLGSSQHDEEQKIHDLETQRREERIDRMADYMPYDEARRRA